MTSWFIQTDDDRDDLGPFRPSELLQKVRAGEVTRETKLRKDDSGWFDAGSVGGLFEAAMRPTIEYFCPHCKRSIPTPPVVCNHCGNDVHRAVTKITENTISSPTEEKHSDQAGRSVQNWLRKKRVGRNPRGQ